MKSCLLLLGFFILINCSSKKVINTPYDIDSFCYNLIAMLKGQNEIEDCSILEKKMKTEIQQKFGTDFYSLQYHRNSVIFNQNCEFYIKYFKKTKSGIYTLKKVDSNEIEKFNGFYIDIEYFDYKENINSENTACILVRIIKDDGLEGVVFSIYKT
jgi:hypothetical protein